VHSSSTHVNNNVLRLSPSHSEKSATDFRVKEKRLGGRPSALLRRDSTSHYSTVDFKLVVPFLTELKGIVYYKNNIHVAVVYDGSVFRISETQGLLV
jgi:hypothetical protein